MRKIYNYLLLSCLLLSGVSMGYAQGGADCANATDISFAGTGTATIAGDLIGGTLDAAMGSCFGNGPGSGDWYVFTPTVSGTMTVTSFGIGGTDSQVSVSTGACGTQTQVACNDDFAGAPFESQVTFPAVAGTPYFIQWGDGWSNAAFNWDVILESCVSPANVSVTAIADISASFGWDANLAAAGYDWEIQPLGVPQGTLGAIESASVATNAASTSVALMPGTGYTFYVRADCGGDSSVYVSLDFTTVDFAGPVGVNCTAPNGPLVVFSEDFEDNAAGWTGVTNAAGGWEIPGDAGSGGTGPDAGQGGGSYTNYEASAPAATSTVPASLISPSIDLTGVLEDVELAFFVHAFGDNLGTLYTVINDLTNATTDTVAIVVGQLQTASNDPWIPVGVNLASYIGSNINLEFIYTHAGTGFEGDMSIDEVTVTTCIDCLVPVATATNVDNCAGGTFDVQVDLTDIVGASSVDIIVNGVLESDDVTALTTYTYSGYPLGFPVSVVVANNDNNTCDLDLGTVVNGLCNPDCSGAIAVGPGVVIPSPGPAVGAGASAVPCVGAAATNAVWYEYTVVSNGIATVSTDFIGASDTRVQVHSGACGALTCVGGDDDSGAGLSSVFSWPVCAGEIYYIEFDDRWDDVAFDFTITEACGDPGLATVTETTDGFTGGTWTGGGASGAACAGSYNWFVFNDGDSPFLGAMPVANGTDTYPANLVVTGLLDATPYDLWIQDDCGASQSSFVVSDFTTLPLCPDVTGLNAAANATGGADLSWADDAAVANGFNWEVHTLGNDPSFGVAVATGSTGVGVTTAVATGAFMDGVTYSLFVQSDCPPLGGYNVQFDFLFQTPPPAPVGVTCTTMGAAPFVLFAEDFEDNTAGWTGVTNANGGWEIPGGATSPNTGPSTGQGGGSYTNYEASAPASTSTTPASLVSPNIDLSVALDDAELSFFMHAFGADLGSLYVIINDITNATSDTVFNFNGQFQTATTDAWAPVGVSLASYIGSTITVEYMYTHSGLGFTGDMSIDEMAITTCSTCSNPVATATNVDNCAMGTFGVDVDLTSLSGASSVDIVINGVVESDDVTALTLYSYTGYPVGTPVTVEVLHNDDNSCDLDLGTVVNGICNADCAGAIAVMPGVSTTAPGPSSGAGYENICGLGAPVANANWYVYTATVNGTATVTSDFVGNPDTRVSILDGNCGALNCITSDDDGGGVNAIFTSLATWNVCAGTDYYIQWDDRWSTLGFDFLLTETAGCLPPGGATLASTTDGFTGGTWAAGTGACTGNYEYAIMTDGEDPDVDAPLQTATGTYPASLDITGLMSNTDYDLYVRDDCDGTNNSTWTLTNFTTLSLTFPGNCAGAEPILAGVLTTAPGPNAGGGFEDICGIAGGAANANWYVFTATVTGTATVTSDFIGNPDTRVSILDGNCGALNCITSDDDGGGVNAIFTSLATWNVCAGTDYYIQWDNRWSPAGFDFLVTETAVAGCADPSAPITVTSINSDGFSGGVWTAGGAVCGGDYEYEILLAPDNNPGTGTEVASGTGTYPALLDVTGLMPNTDYELWIRDNCTVGGSSNWVLTTFLTQALPPVNDECDDAIVVFGGYSITGFSTLGATGTDVTSCTLNDIASVWFEYTPTCDIANVEVNSFGSTYDTNLSIFDDCAALPVNELDCNDDAGGTFQSQVNFAATAGVTYYIRIAGFNGSTGDIDFTLIESTPCPCTANVWTGAVNNDWNNDGNWTCGIAPTNACAAGSDDVIIPAGSSVIPVVTVASGAGNIEVATGASIDITGNLEVCGNVVHNGNPITGTGDLELVGAAVQTIDGDGTFANLTLNNAMNANVMVTADVAVSNSILLTAGTLTNAGSVTLLSDAAGTAFLDDFSGAGSYAGDITVQRFVPNNGSGLGQRFFGSAVSGSAVTGLDATYAGGATGYLIPDGCSPTTLAAGSPYSNLFSWDETNVATCDQEGYFAMASSSALTPGEGYSGWMNDGSTLEVTGPPNTGAVSFNGLGNSNVGIPASDGWHILSNPYPTPIAMSAVAASGFTSPMYYNAMSGAFSGTFQAVTPASSISIMQGFVAQVPVGPATNWSVTDGDRIAANQAAFFASSGWYAHKLDVIVNGNGHADMTSVYYSDNSTAAFDAYGDCVKRASDVGQPTLYTVLGDDVMSLNGYSMNEFGQSIPMGIAPGTDAKYTFTFDGLGTFPANTTIYVEDKLLDVYHNVADGAYEFIASIEHDENRFEIHFVPAVELVVTDVACDGTLGAVELLDRDFTDRNYTLLNNGVEVATGNISDFVQPVDAGMYTMVIADQFGGNQTYTFEVEQMETIIADFTASSLNVEVNEMITFNNITANASTIEWIIDGNVINGVEDLTYAFATAGSYEVELNVANAQCSDARKYTVNVSDKASAIHNLGGDQLVKVYASGNLVNITFENVEASNANVEIFNMLGQSMTKEVIPAEGNQAVKVLNAADGYYIVKLTVADNSTSTKVILTKE